MVELELTYPPSVNHYYKKWCNKNRVMVAVDTPGSSYRAEVLRYKLQRLRGMAPLKTRLSVEVEVWKPDRRKRDIDNPLKCLLDAISYAKIWEDDELIDCLLIHCRGVEAPGKIRVTIREM